MASKITRELGLFFVLACPLLAQLPAPPASQQNPQSARPVAKATLSGKVIDAATGKPLRKAWIVMRKIQDRQAPYGGVTDAEGNFTIRDIDPARYMLSATRTGYVNHQYGQRTGGRVGTPLTVDPGAELKDITFKMQPGGVIAGRVVDEDGEPVSNVQMMLMRYTYMEGERRLAPAQGARTDDRGEYRIFGLSTGKYYLSASMRNVPSEVVSGPGPAEEGYAAMFYPGVTDLNSAQAIELKAGNEERADLTFVPTRTYKVRGRLVDGQTGEPAKNANVGLIRRGQFFGIGFMGGLSTHVSKGDGVFEIRGVTPGSYSLTGYQWQEGGMGGNMARLDIEVGEADVDNVTLNTQPGRTFPGTVKVEGAAADFKVTGITVWMQAAHGPQMFFGPGQSPVKQDGSFQLRNLAEEDYTVRVMGASPDMYLKSVRVGGDDVLENGFNVSRAKAASLDIVLSTNGASVEGVATQDDKGFGGAQVVLVPEASGRAKPQRAKVATADQNGKFTVRGIRPGSYRIYAFEEIEQGAYDDPEYMRQFRDEGDSISFSEGSRQSATLKVIPAGAGQ